MIKRLLALGLFGAAVLPAVLPAFAQSASQGKYGGPTTVNATVVGAYPAATPSLAPGATSQLQLDQQGNLNVHIQAGSGGGSGGAVYPAVGSSPFPFVATSTVPINGSVSVSNLPVTQAVSGTVSIGNFPTTQTVTGSVSVSNLPATQPVSIATTLPVSVAATVNVACVSGCGGSSGATAQYSSPLPVYTPGTVTPQYDQNGRALFNGTIYAASPLPVMGSQFARTYVGSTITAGGTAQNWASTGAIVHGCEIQNTSSGPEYIRMDGSAASATSLLLVANGGYYECPVTGLPTTSVSIYGATTGQSYFGEIW